MVKLRGILIIFLLLLTASIASYADTRQYHPDTLEVYFYQGYSTWQPKFRDNGKNLQLFLERFKQKQANKQFNKIPTIHIVAGCSPEGLWSNNQRLARKRAATMKNILKDKIQLPDSIIVEDIRGINWAGLRKMVEKDPNMPNKEEVLWHIDNSPEVVRNAQGKLVEARKLRLAYLADGVPWRYMYDKFFPSLRSFHLAIVIEWKKTEPLPAIRSNSWRPLEYQYKLPPIPEPQPLPEPEPQPEPERKPFYMAAKTNLIYDALLVPNAGLEFYLGKDFSIAGNWMYAWWKHDAIHWYWRIYGGDMALRKWFGRAAKEKPLTGHHAGVYAQMLTYDFETGNRGYMGGEPGGTLWDKANYVCGLEYGYSLPIARRLNIDFVVGAGYMWGEYHEYIPQDNCYVWQVTKKRRWIGPTKAEISLVWQIGYGNVNRNKGRKGGER